MKNPHSSESASRPDNGLRFKQLAGTVIGAACRDVRFCADLGFPIYGRSYAMHPGTDGMQFVDRQDPVTVGTALNPPDDIFRGDDDGVVVVSKDHEVAILTIVEEIDVAEQLIRVHAGVAARLDVARKKIRLSPSANAGQGQKQVNAGLTGRRTLCLNR